MVQAPSIILTLAEFWQLPERKPAREYLDGQMIQKPMSQGKYDVSRKI
jgi:Uma2 family endonuclease